MSDIRADTTCFIFFTDSRGRIWVSGTETRRNRLGDLILVPILDDEARYAKPWRFDLAQIAARRFSTEGYLNPAIKLKFALQASDSAEEISSAEAAPVFRDDQRVPMHYRGLIAVPGRTSAGPSWYVRFPGMAIESIRGATPEEAVDKTYERNLQDKAEKYVAPPEPQTLAQIQNNCGFRRRPGDIR